MFKTLLYPMDFSDTVGKNLEYLKQLRNAGAEKIVLLNVIHQRIIDTLETVNKAAFSRMADTMKTWMKPWKNLKRTEGKRWRPLRPNWKPLALE